MCALVTGVQTCALPISERQGRSVAALVAGTGLDPADFARPGWRGPVEAMAGLVRNIWASLDDEWMGYTVRPAAPGSFAFACELAPEGRDVAAGLRRAARFYNLLAAGHETRITLGRDALRGGVGPYV